MAAVVAAEPSCRRVLVFTVSPPTRTMCTWNTSATAGAQIGFVVPAQRLTHTPTPQDFMPLP